jgi:hypothetical protein
VTGKNLPYYQSVYQGIRKRCLCFLLLSCTCFQHAIAQIQMPEGIEETTVELRASDIGDTVVTALIIKEKAWLSIEDVFRFLGINHTSSTGGDSLYGFFLTPQTAYLIEEGQARLLLNGTITKIGRPGLMLYNHTLFLRADLFFVLFKLNCRFDYRSLSVNLSTMLELPAIIRKKQVLMRNNIGRLTNELTADTSLPLSYPAFRLGMIDWSVNTMQDFKGVSDNRVNLAVGGVIAGGETILSLQYNNKTILSPKQQYYLWRRVNNNSRLLKQISLGKINGNATSSIYAPVIGVQFTNSPTFFRRNFGTYHINRYTQPGWIAELYINGTLIAYTKADATGLFSFDIPIVYGNTLIQVRYYGPDGEQYMGEANISMPFTFLPVGNLEYTVSAGVLEDNSWSRFFRAKADFGLSRRITIGTGMEYLSSVTDNKRMPFITANFRLSRNMLFSSEYTHGVRSNITGHYRLPSNMLFEMNYTKYVKGQKAILNTYLEEKRAAVSFPMHLKNFNSYTRFSFYQIILADSKYTTAEFLLSGIVFNTGINFTTYALFADNNPPYLYSNVSLAIRIPGKILLMPHAQYEYNNSQFISIKAELEKRITTKGYITGFYERNFKSNFTSINIGIRYNLPYAEVGLDVRKNNAAEPSVISSLRGSIMYDNRTGYTGFSKDQLVGRSGLIISAFLDLNNNGRKDAGEPKLKGLKFIVNGGFRQENNYDTVTVIRNLEPYNSYLITIDKNSFDEIAWRIQHSVIKVETGPQSVQVTRNSCTGDG